MSKATGLKRIGSDIPKSLEAALKYSGKSRWLAIYQDQDIAEGSGLGIVLADGLGTYAGERQPWELVLQQSEGAWKPKKYWELDDSEDFWFLIDRHDRNVYIGKRETVEAFLSQPNTQKLLLELDHKRPRQLPMYSLAAEVTLGLLILGGGVGVISYGAYQGAIGVVSHFQEQPVVTSPAESQKAKLAISTKPANSKQEISLKQEASPDVSSQDDAVEVKEGPFSILIDLTIGVISMGVLVSLGRSIQKSI